MPSPTDYAIGAISLGCAKNLVDTEHMSARLQAAGYKFTADMASADILWVNTCAFIHDARRESIDAILEAAAMKKTGACRFLLVTGCLAQRYQLAAAEALPEVDAFLGLDQLDKITTVLDNWRRGRPEPRAAGIRDLPRRLYNPPAGRQVLTGGPYAYVKISEGCHHRCCFCAIPSIRGRTRSRAMKAILKEVDDLLGSGIREINLVAQDTTAYGRDRRDGANLPALLRSMGKIGGRFWIRILYGFPTLISDSLLRAMVETPAVCRYLDVPIQHSDPEILRRMGRFGTLTAVNNLAARARAMIPDITLRTTCMVGHPGEDRAAFEHLRKFLAAAQFDHLGVFVYSLEENTPSSRQTGGVDPATARRRRARLLREQQDRVIRQHKNLVGYTDSIMVETSHTTSKPFSGSGRSMSQAPEVDGITKLRGNRLPRPGQFVNVRYQAADGYDMLADIL